MILDHLFTRTLFESQTDHITQFASNAHEEWRRNFDPTGTKPRIKKNSDGTEGDINVPFADLHPDWQKENLAAAHAAHRAVKHFGRDMEKAAEYVHNEWMKRNPKADYNAAQHVPYDDLPEDEKEKDRVHVRTMMQLMGHSPEQGVAEGSGGNWYIRVNGKILNDTKFKPVIFSSEDEARSHAMKLADKKRIPLSQMKLTKSWMDAPEPDVAENNHWHAAGVADAERDVKRNPNRKVKTLNPRTRLKTMQDKQARHPEEVEQYSQGYRSVKQGVAESNTLMKKLHQALLKEGRVKELADDLKTLNDAEFMKKYGKAKAAIRRDMKKVDENKIEKTKTGIIHRGDSYGGGEELPNGSGSRSGFPNPGKYAKDLDHLDKNLTSKLDKSMGISWPHGNKKQDIDEGNMPQSVIKSKQKYADMSDQEFHAAHKNKSEDDLKNMAWRHGYGKGSNHYVTRHKKGGSQLNELSTNKLAQYKTAAAADAKKADQSGDVKRGDKRFGGIVKATKKQFDNDAKKIEESRQARQALMAQIANSR